jgi:hydrogenase assembly chaperone HypC/HupF
MCLSLPAQVITVRPDTAEVVIETRRFAVGRRLAPDLQSGDWVLANAGQIVSRLAPEEAEAIRELVREIAALGQDGGLATEGSSPEQEADLHESLRSDQDSHG